MKKSKSDVTTATTHKMSILIIDDERNTREIMGRFLQGEYDVTLADDGVHGAKILKDNNFDLVLTDLRMPGVDGFTVLEETLKKNPAPPCIMITAYGSVENAVKAVKAGAFDFVTKPVNFDQLEIVINRALESQRLINENKELKRKLDKASGDVGIIAKSMQMKDIMDTVRQVAPSRTTVLVTGESGTGKELIAQALHRYSGRPGKILPVHCAALSSNLLESELFGHEKGAFTGASEQRKGRFELADQGTLFLDEIGEIDQQIQVKLLRALETHSFERVGGSDTIYSDCRLVAATNRDLRQMVIDGEFREDLFYRLDVVRIHLPPLRERQEDIPLLVKHFIDDFAFENHKNINSITEDALELLCAYDWPGNIRELRNCIERMVVLCRGDVLDKNNVPFQISGKGGRKTAIPLAQSSLDIDKNEKLLIVRALEECDGNRTNAAQKLGISRRTLHRKLKIYNID
ncbi:MAG: sigma-54-dependent Fis family transcriptional regulator [Victivallales bacterium]|nr:sigma-54-dependent Fis family transcriptional regulator [Victivallales bacterium]